MKPKKTVFGVGVNDADYVTKKQETIGHVNGKRIQKVVWRCPYYQAWASMLNRCYSAKYQDRNPTYAGCTVSEDWLTFSSFKNWMQEQDFEGMQLDKDLLLEGNKIYSSATCVFVTPMVNSFTNDQGTKRGEWMIGVHLDKASGEFRALCRNPFSGKREDLGRFTCEQQAHNAWAKRKLELAHLLAAEQTDERVAKALILKYTNYKQSRCEIG